MRIALYSRQRDIQGQDFINSVIEYLVQNKFDVLLHDNCLNESRQFAHFKGYEELKSRMPVDFVVSIGGDGSFIDAANLVGNLGIPLVGINTGRIGFLSGIKKDNFRDCFRMLREHQYSIEHRSLLHLDSSMPVGLNRSFAINDIVIRAADTDSIKAITVWAGDSKVNTYWADGLIIATPTGSTAYSLSCGGSILHPQTQVHVLTPIAPHSLSVRPLVIPSDIPLQIQVSGNSGQYSLCVDTECVITGDNNRLLIRKEDFDIHTVLFENTDFYNIIREKLLWGIDKRNT